MRRNDVAQYNRKYYAENKERINFRRKVQYHSDPEHRGKLLSKYRKYNELRSFSRKTVRHGGASEVTLSLFRAARYGLFGRSYDTMYRIKVAGLLPMPLYTTTGGEPRYAVSQVMLIAYTLGQAKHGFSNLTEKQVSDVLTRFWKRRFHEEEVKAYIEKISKREAGIRAEDNRRPCL